MLRVQLFIARSLDGFIADDGGGISWLEPFQKAGEDHGYRRFMAHVGAVAMGARTYEVELGWDSWPYQRQPTFVFTHRERPVPAGADVRFVTGGVAQALAEIDAATDENVFLVGGADLIRQFLEARAIDELLLFVAPVLLGSGLPLFLDPPPLVAELIETRTYSTGIVGMRYSLATAGTGCSDPSRST
jgi:dihydrofolate reductase